MHKDALRRLRRFGPLASLFSLILFTSFTAFPIAAAEAQSLRAPSNLRVTAPEDRLLVLRWRDNSNNELGFKIERRPSSTNRFTQIATMPTGSTRFVDGGVTPGVRYYYRVRAYNNRTHSSYSNTAYRKPTGSAPPPPTPTPAIPAAPSSLGASAPEPGIIVLTWRDNSNNEEGFKIERHNGQAFVQVATMPAGSTRYVDGGLANGTTYSFRIRAYNAAGHSAYSNTVQQTTMGGVNPTPTPQPPTPTPTPAPTQTPGQGGNFPVHPQKALWESNMLGYGQTYCNERQILDLSTWEGNVWYYDGIRVYQQIAEYTGDPSWYNCARYVRSVYRNYVINNPRTPGWRVFPHGLAEDYRRTNDAQSREAVRILAQESAFAWAGGDPSHEISRETAYLIHAYLAAEDLGFGRHANLATAVNYALGHLNQWTGNQSAPFVKPFMMGLTFEALIHYHSVTGDSRVLPAVQQSADWLWNNMWNPQLQAFPYILCRAPNNNAECQQNHDGEGADLNLLIAPVYGWLYRMTGNPTYIQRGDAVFAGGVRFAWLGNGKQFSQNYRWSFDYLRWRDGE